MGRDKDGELMNVTENYGLKKPEKNEYISVDVINENIDAIDTELKKKIDVSGGDTAETIVSDFETSAESFPVPAAKEKAKTGWGKVKKFGEDFKAWMTGVCLLGHIVNNCVTNNPNLPLSAAQGKVLMDLYTVLNTKQNESAATIEKLWNGNHVINELPDDTSPDEIVDDGYYSVYTSIKGKRYRWILHNKAVVAASQVYYRIQTAYYYMGAGSAYNILPLQRNIYYTGSVFGYTEWHEI